MSKGSCLAYTPIEVSLHILVAVSLTKVSFNSKFRRVLLQLLPDSLAARQLHGIITPTPPPGRR